jgi:hypothetical protein
MEPFSEEHGFVVGKRIAEKNVYYRCPVIQNGVRCTCVTSKPDPDTN